MNRAEIKKFAKEKIKGHILELLIPIIVVGVLTGLTVGVKYEMREGIPVVTNSGYNLGLFFGFLEVGLAAYMINFINDKKSEFKDLFAYINDYIRIFVTQLLQVLFIFVFLLLLIVPGIIKAYSYAMVNYLLADEKYKELKFKELLDLSEKMMDGHKADLFMLQLSYIGWYFLVLITFGIAAIYVAPLVTTAMTKFMYEVKKDYEAKNA